MVQLSQLPLRGRHERRADGHAQRWHAADIQDRAPLANVAHTEPWTGTAGRPTWKRHAQSLTETMLGPQPTDDDVQALVAFLDTLETPPNPHRDEQGALSAAAQRGQAVFQSEQAGCSKCHAGSTSPTAKCMSRAWQVARRLRGFQHALIVGRFHRVRLLHDGRAKSLEQVLSGPDAPHDPINVAGKGELSESELADLVEYLKSL